MGNKSRMRMTDLTEEGRIKRSSIRKAEDKKKRKEMEKKVAEQLATAILRFPPKPRIINRKIRLKTLNSNDRKNS